MISENPSLYFKPEAYKTDVVYLQLPEGTIGNMTFARTSVATRFDKNGLVEEVATGIPRLDYTNGTCPELLLEPTRINICLRSEEFEHALWVDSSQMTVTANASVSLDGTKTADKIVYVDNGSSGTVAQNITVVDATKHELSIYMKGQKGGEKVQIDFRNTASVGTAGTEVTLTKDWVRYTENILSDGTARGFQIRCITGNGDSTFYVWGAQLESGDYGTSYIKTTTVSVTRATEELNSGGDSTTFNSIEGVLYAEISALFNDGTERTFCISDDTASNRVMLKFITGNQISYFVIVGSGTQATASIVVSDITDVVKVAVKWKLNDFALWINGVEEATDGSGSTFGADVLTDFSFDNSVGNDDFYGRTKEVRVYKTALTDAELTELTTL